MQTTLFVRLIKPGKVANAKAFIDEFTGSKKDEYADLLLRYKLNNAKIWFLSLEDKDYMLFTHDMDDDAMECLQSWNDSAYPFDQWFNSQLGDIFDLDNEPELPAFYKAFDARN